jgi:protein-S-isoprenylcysteine O-methyltransferase Ste14
MAIRFIAAISGLIVIILPLASLLRSSGRAKGRKIGRGSALRRWPAVAFITIGLIAFGALLWKPLPFELFGALDPIVLALGAIMYFPAIGFYLWGWITLGKFYAVSNTAGADLYSDHRIIKDGPYQHVRHPMYLAVILSAIGALLIFRTWAMVVFFPMTLVVIRRANREEALLEMEFGSEWREYQGKVPKWFPRWLRKV